MIGRRGFMLSSSGGIFGALLANMAGCPFTSVYQAIEQYAGVGLQAFQSVVDLLSGAGVIPIGTGTLIDAVIALAKAGFADIETAVANYQNAPAADKATLLGKISTALAAAQGAIGQFWNDLSIPDPKLASLVQGLLGVILSTLAGFATQLPAPAPGPVTQRRDLALKGWQAMPVAKKRTAAQFKKDFNSLLQSAGYSQYSIR